MTITRANTSKNYAAMAAAKITTPAAEAKKRGGTRKPNLLIYGRYKKGKTRFCLTAGRGKILIIDPEHGTDYFEKANPSVWHIKDWAEFNDLYNFLKSGQHDYEWVAIDGLTRIAKFALKHVRSVRETKVDLSKKPQQTRIQDYGFANDLLSEMFYKFSELPMGVIFTAQERQIGGNEEEEDDDIESVNVQYVPDLTKGARASINSLVDVIGRIYTVKMPGEEGGNVVKRRLWLAPSVSYDTGARSEYKLPEYLENPTVPRLLALLEGKKIQ